MRKTLFVGLILILFIMVTGCSKAGDESKNNKVEENQTSTLEKVIEEPSEETETNEVTSLETTNQSESNTVTPTYEEVYDHTVRVKVDGNTFSLWSSMSTSASMIVDNSGNYYLTGTPDKLANFIAISNNEYTVVEESPEKSRLIIGQDVANKYFEWDNVNYGSNQSYFNISFANGEKKYKSTSKPGEQQGFVTINGKTYFPLDDFFTALGIECKIEYDEQEDLVYFIY